MQHYTITETSGLNAAAKDIVKSMRSVPSAFLLLSGDLGAGKTTLAQEIAKELGVKEAVQSPTYSLLKSYELPRDLEAKTLHHLDLYRVENLNELEAAGIIDLMSRGQGYFIVEWPRFLEGILPYAPLVMKCELVLEADGTRLLTRT